MLLMAVAWSSGGFAIRYVLPVSWMTSYLHNNQPDYRRLGLAFGPG